jgi:hypothetical protein
MGQRRLLTGLLVLHLLSLIPAGLNASPRNNPTYDGQVEFGSQLLHLSDGCLSVHGALTAGDFFYDLKRLDKNGQIEYRKGGKPVTEYPESLTTSIRITGDPCLPSVSNAPAAIFRGASYSLELKVYWKRDMKMRPATLSPVVAHCVGYSTLTDADENLKSPSVVCEMTVDSKGVPIGDHLIVSILGADGARLTRISAAP